MMKRSFIYLVLIWAYVYSNSRLAFQEMGAGTEIYSLFGFIGQESRIIETLIVLLFFFHTIILNLRAKNELALNEFQKVFILLSFQIALICFFTINLNGINIAGAFSAIYQLLLPFILLFITISYDYDKSYLLLIKKVIYFVFFLNTAVIFHQWLFLFNGEFVHGDYFRGIFSDSHAQAIFSFSLALMFLLYLIKTKKRKYLFLFIVSCFAAVIAQNEKAAIFFILVILLLFIGELNLNRYLTFFSVFLIGSFILVYIKDVLEALAPRALSFVDISNIFLMIPSIGFIAMLITFYYFILDSPLILFTGLGPATFGSPACLRMVRENLSNPWAREYFYSEVSGDFSWLNISVEGLAMKNSFFVSSLGEYGLIIFVQLGILISKMFKMIKQNSRIDHSNYVFVKSQKYILIYVLLCSVISTIGSWDTQIVLTPLILIIGINSNKYNQYKLSKINEVPNMLKILEHLFIKYKNR